LACEYNSTANTVKVMDGFKFGFSEADPPILTWKFGSLNNPRGLITTGMFNVTIYNSKN